MTPSPLSRRDFLKLSGAGLLSALLASPHARLVRAASAPSAFGRVAFRSVTVHDQPSAAARELARLERDDLVGIAEQVAGEMTNNPFNTTWFRLSEGGYVYSGGIQPVTVGYHEPLEQIASAGMVAEVSVPFVDTFWKPGRGSKRAYRLYYESTHWVRETIFEADGSSWYRIYDDRLRRSYYAPARSLRVLPMDELAPIAPDVPAEFKFIEVDLSTQRVTAYEDGQPVFSALASSGRKQNKTPTGIFTTFHKRSTVRMTGGASLASMYDLPGVPWATFITENGIAFHGTYWHNDYGRPTSAGCINLRSPEARWIFRWTTPALPVERRWLYRPGQGTTVHIFYS